MPVYVYRNLTTGDTFEIEQRITDDALMVDPTTGDPVKRLIQPVGIAFKGSGFYVTDSRSNGRSKGRAASSSEGASSSGDAAAGSGDGAASSSGGGAASTSTSDAPSKPAASTPLT
jgi:predicted nucleic acid-binding Zn ribbon protein